MSETQSEAKKPAPKKFRTLPGRGSVRIALTSGHETWVTEELAPLEPVFHAAALAAGCISEDMLSELSGLASLADDTKGKKPKLETIAEVMAAMLDSGEEAYIDETGKPILELLSDKCGFRVTAKERDQVFERLSHAA